MVVYVKVPVGYVKVGLEGRMITFIEPVMRVLSYLCFMPCLPFSLPQSKIMIWYRHFPKPCMTSRKYRSSDWPSSY